VYLQFFWRTQPVTVAVLTANGHYVNMTGSGGLNASNASGVCVFDHWVAGTDIFLVFILAVIAAFFPYFVATSRQVISWINCLGAGILLGACFSHLLPEVKESFQEQCYEADKLDFEMFVLVGFLLILILEQFTLTYFSHLCGGHSHGDTTALVNKKKECRHSKGIEFETERFVENIGHSHIHTIGAEKSFSPHCSSPDANGSHVTAPSSISKNVRDSGIDEMEQHLVPLTQNSNVPRENEDHCHEDIQQHSGIRSLAFVSSLSIHCIIEGVALVLRASSWADNLPILLSIVFHKTAIGLTMGFTIKQSNLSRKMSVVALFLWASFTPLGSILGLGLCKYEILEAAWLPPVNAIGLGTFLYVLFFEIAPHEFLGAPNGDNRFIKSLLLSGAVATMFVFARMTPHGHGHGHGHRGCKHGDEN